MTNAEYLRAYHQRPKYKQWQADYRAQRRARGICLYCGAISVKYLRCVVCRAAAAARRRLRRAESRANNDRLTSVP